MNRTRQHFMAFAALAIIATVTMGTSAHAEIITIASSTASSEFTVDYPSGNTHDGLTVEDDARSESASRGLSQDRRRAT